MLQQDIKYLTGVGPNRAKLLADELHIHTLGDLLHYYPYKYVDRTKVYRIADITNEMPYVQIVGEILSFAYDGMGRKRRLIARFSDGSAVAELVWFHGIKFIEKQLKVHTPYVVFGKPSLFGGRPNLIHPDIDPASELTLNNMGMQPYYHTTDKMKRSGLNSRAMERLTTALLATLKTPFQETLPTEVILRYHLMPADEALRVIHYPTTTRELESARVRLKFEELFYVQLAILRYAAGRQRRFRGLPMPRVGEHFHQFFQQNLPFPLTDAQKRVLHEIHDDMKSGVQMNRLLQGDVGSGKTLVALMTMLLATDNGYQACLMAPTEILAEQHVETLRSFLFGMPVRVELLTGQVKGKRREALLEDLRHGDIHILVGTHAVIQEWVDFQHLGVVVIDEQHRFGVAQRAKLWEKNDTPPHVLVMTATPIPRTLAMTLYGDLQVSVIDQLPPGRKPVQTTHQFDTHWQTLVRDIRAQIQQGRQIYVVYPLIKESEKIDLKNLEDGYLHFCQAFPECRISRVHGKMKPAEKDEEMRRFVTGETQILVATTVIEVGVNVPNASVMIIENADRFGLSQLHQLRGRVGRGSDQSYCILVTGFKLAEDTRKRIDIMCQTTDGFEIAEADLRLRGPGDLEGTQQSGQAFDLRIADLARDGQILTYARQAAQQIIDADADLTLPQHALLVRQLRLLKKDHIDWSAIS